MKHIERKFLHEFVPNQGLLEKINAESFTFDSEKYLRMQVDEDEIPLLITEDRRCIQAFEFTMGGKKVLIPEFDPILIYFNNAQAHLSMIDENKKALESAVSTGNYLSDHIKHILFKYYGSCSIYVVFLCLALEACINRAIKKVEYQKTFKDGSIVKLSAEEIQKLSFKEKLTKVLPEASGIKYSKFSVLGFNSILQLFVIRDEIVHTKTSLRRANIYSGNFSMVYRLEHHKTIHYSKEFINFCFKKLIQECKCGEDF